MRKFADKTGADLTESLKKIGRRNATDLADFRKRLEKSIDEHEAFLKKLDTDVSEGTKYVKKLEESYRDAQEEHLLDLKLLQAIQKNEADTVKFFEGEGKHVQEMLRRNPKDSKTRMLAQKGQKLLDERTELMKQKKEALDKIRNKGQEGFIKLGALLPRRLNLRLLKLKAKNTEDHIEHISKNIEQMKKQYREVERLEGEALKIPERTKALQGIVNQHAKFIEDQKNLMQGVRQKYGSALDEFKNDPKGLKEVLKEIERIEGINFKELETVTIESTAKIDKEMKKLISDARDLSPERLERSKQGASYAPVSYTHLTLPTKA